MENLYLILPVRMFNNTDFKEKLLPLPKKATNSSL